VVATAPGAREATLSNNPMAPVIVVVGEPLRRYYLRRLSRPPMRMRSAGCRPGSSAVALAELRQQHRVIPILKALPPAMSDPARRVGSSA